MRKIRLEIAIVALILAPLLGYAIGYVFAGNSARDARPAAAASDRPAPLKDGGLGT